jgi:hypothetical protein
VSSPDTIPAAKNPRADGSHRLFRWKAIDGAEIDDAVFERLHAGLDASGRKLTQNADGTHADRVAGMI